ncbi:UBIQUITIN-CONJUGAT-2 domain-containing protein [Mycena indigotica]|uniref:UBIQUITIN-CONJUGAT-2 domain-containing protein n=1 Tax=Mycena indigotica TaxID=2126181 RepID=A0A8H6SZX7_9AGAR|nr:UBIQUITIN-CONJUGAT-2 domain-containing protein [Mycena indigotica]KAF7307392.1 UBIQUITIN-CONJUGAT-2 domain-containing protein [Mycena indigotica]
MPPKRRRSASPSKARKRARVPDEDVIVISDEEDDLEEILALIKQNEESEKLARQLNQSTHHSTQECDDDEALARRLAAEWDALDQTQENPEPGPSKSGSASEPRSHIHNELDASPDIKLNEFRPFFTAARPCSKCGKMVAAPRGFVVFSPTPIPGGITPSLGMLLHASCSSCDTNHCRGCFSPLQCSSSCKGAGGFKSQKCKVESCCAGVRAIAIFECLGGFDRLTLGEKVSSESRSSQLARQKYPKSRTVGPGGTGYGTGGQTGYSPGNSKNKAAAAAAAASRQNQLSDHWDELIVRAFQTLTQLLPSPYADDAQEYDLLPHSSIGDLISLSQIPELLAVLLRNDSVTDWTARSQVYYAMIALLRRMSDCELTVEVIINRRFCMEKAPGLEDWMWGDDTSTELVWARDKDGQLERAPPLYDYFKKVAKQCEAFLAGARTIMDSDEEHDDTETVQAISLCGDLLAAGNDMERAMSILGRESNTASTIQSSPSKVKGKTRDPAVELERNYSKSCEGLAFSHVEMDMRKYNYHDLLKQTEISTRAPKHRLHLLKELATMATSLPPGIFVRVDEVRNDAIKVMIAGPEGTPYAGGLFEFDCYMPLEYPTTPPLVYLRTTGGGTVRFNPNLYNTGKVCLSLLGTWPGRPEEQWSPFKSTFLQVLVSIQSMILIDAPYFNEPGHGQVNPNAPASVMYNLEIQRQTCRWGIVEWLEESNKREMWKDVIGAHFSIRKDRIRQQMQAWSESNSGIRSYFGGRSTQVVDLIERFDTQIRNWVE